MGRKSQYETNKKVGAMTFDTAGFKAFVVEQARSLLAAQESFKQRELAYTFGDDEWAWEGWQGPVAENRHYLVLRHTLERLVEADVLLNAGRGFYIAGAKLHDDGALGELVRLHIVLVREAIREGGFLTGTEAGYIAEKVGRFGDLAPLNVVYDVLNTSPWFYKDMHIDGLKRMWRLRDELLDRVPVSGRFIGIDVRIEHGRKGVGLAGPSFLSAFNARLLAMRDALFEARRSAGVETAQAAVAIPEIALHLGRSLYLGGNWIKIAAPSDWYRNSREAGLRKALSGTMDVSDLYKVKVENDGEAAALAWAWEQFEAPEAAFAVLIQSVTTDFWNTVGGLWGYDPADLSRGRLSPRTKKLAAA